MVCAALDWEILDDEAILMLFDVELGIVILPVDEAALDQIVTVETEPTQLHTVALDSMPDEEVLDRGVADVEETVPNW